MFELQSNECPPDLLQILIKAYQRSSLMGCSIEAKDSSEMESALPNGNYFIIILNNNIENINIKYRIDTWTCIFNYRSKISSAIHWQSSRQNSIDKST